MNNENKILDMIRMEADEKAAAIRRETDAAVEAADEACANRIKDMRTKNAAKCEREREVVLRRGQGSSDMRRREIMLDARVKLRDKAYADAESFICEMDRDAYAALLANLLADALADRLAEDRALAECGEKVDSAAFEVSFNEKDKDELGERVIAEGLARLAERGESAPKVTLSGKTANIGGGFILRSDDVSCDCSVKTLVALSRASTGAEAAQVLFQ